MTPLCNAEGVWLGSHGVNYLWTAVLGMEMWLNVVFVYGGGFYLFNLYFPGIACFLEYIDLLWNSASPNAVTSSHIRNRITQYRRIHILEKMFNSYIGNTCIPYMMGILPAIQIFAVYGCIQFYPVVEMPQYLIFPLMAVDAFLCNATSATLSSFINMESEHFLTKCKNLNSRKLVGTKTGMISREVKACSALKIRFGSNYIDSGTPLMIQHFCWVQTLQMLMIMSKW
ncbi:uncharacterized protein LOC118438840 [Folsomia candida]|nr:uncharacterized protein LOC118438840 [Folsomia candida]